MKKRLKEPEIRDLIGKWLEDNECWIVMFLRKHDFEMFDKNMKLSQVARLARENGLTAPLRHISILVKDYRGLCFWWGRRVNAVSRNTDATPEYWDKLKYLAIQYSKEIEGRDFDFAMRVVRRFMPTNRNLMNGLPERLKVWNR